MKLITFTDADGAELLERLELLKLRRQAFANPTTIGVFDDLYRAFHYEVVAWLQAQGASVQREDGR